MNVQSSIQTLIFGNSEDKFFYDPITDSQKINQKYLKDLKEYAVMKTLVCNSANKNMMVDVNLLLSLVEQVKLRFKMITIQMKLGNIEVDKTEDEIFTDILYELSKT